VVAQEQSKKKERQDEDDEDQQRAFIEQQLAAARARAAVIAPEAAAAADPVPVPEAAIPAAMPEAAAAVALPPPPPPSAPAPVAVTPLAPASSPIVFYVKQPAAPVPAAAPTVGQKRVFEGERPAKRQEAVVQPNWLHQGIVVKVLNKKLADGKYAGRKGTSRVRCPAVAGADGGDAGVVVRVERQFAAAVRMLEGGDLLLMDQNDLQTVLPISARYISLLIV
jgi:hypothetical protein